MCGGSAETKLIVNGEVVYDKPPTQRPCLCDHGDEHEHIEEGS